MCLKKSLPNLLIVCFLNILQLPVSAQTATEDTKITLENENYGPQARGMVFSFMRIAQSLVGVALAIYLAIVIKKVYEAKGEGGGAIVGWFSAVLIWMVMTEIIIKLMATNISH